MRATIAILLLALAIPARAAEAPTEADLVKRGVAAREQGHDQAALELFRQAFDQFHTPRAQAQLGLACQALGRWSEADENLRAALSATTDAWITNNRKALEQAQAVVGQHIGTLDVIGNVNDAEVLIDGRRVAMLPLRAPLRLGAGTAIVQVRAEGYAFIQKPVTIVAGQLTRESFSLVPIARTVSAPPRVPAFVEAPAPAEGGPSLLQRRATFIGAAAATAIVGGIALWSGLDTLSARDRYRDHPTQPGYDDGVKRERRTNILIAGTAVLGAGTLALGLFSTRW
jgi:hypothetical protein